MKFLVYGTHGWIGAKVLKLLQESNSEVVEGKTRINNVKELEAEIEEIQPTHVISLIGRTHGVYNNRVYGTIDYLEQPGKLVENVRDNLFSPMILSLLSKKYNYHFTYLGTGCIFEFDKEHPFGEEVNGFTEESLPNFFGSSYSIVKGFTDQLMHLVDDTVLNVRIRMPITDEFNGRNFITKITNYAKICSVPNSMTVLNELLPMMIDMAKNNVTGTVNLTNPGLITHNEILEMYKTHVDPLFVWENFTIEEQNKILDSGRSNNFLETVKLESMYPSVMNIKDSVREILIKMAQNNKNK
jgi:nucleoside-diphosphate-sugar epimerase